MVSLWKRHFLHRHKTWKNWRCRVIRLVSTHLGVYPHQFQRPMMNDDLPWNSGSHSSEQRYFSLVQNEYCVSNRKINKMIPQPASKTYEVNIPLNQWLSTVKKVQVEIYKDVSSNSQLASPRVILAEILARNNWQPFDFPRTVI